MLLFSLLVSATSIGEMPVEEIVKDTVALPEIIITESGKTKIDLLPLTTTIVTQAQIEKSAESSLLPVLENKVPGMFVTERGMAGFGVSGGAAGTVNIRGVGQGNKVLFMIDGQPQWAGIFGHALPDTYVANGVDHVEVVRGPSSLLYGSNAMGGSVNIITRKATQDGFRGAARAMIGSYTTQRYGLTGGYKKDKWNASAGVTFDASNGNRAGSHFWLANEYLQTDYSASKHWEIGANLHMTQTKAHNPGSVQSPLESMWTKVFRGTAAIYASDRYDKANGGVQVYVNWGRNHVDDGWTPGDTPTNYIYNSSDYNTGFTVYQTVNPWNKADLSVGFDLQQWGGHHWNQSKATDEEIEGSDFKKHETETGVYLMLQQALLRNDMLSLNAGIRYQHGSQYGSEWIPQAGFILKPCEGSSLKFSFGKGFRAPNLRELYLYVPANPDLKPEYLYNYEIEWRQWLLDRRLNFGISFFFIDGKNMIQTAMINGRPHNENTGAFINKGFEVDAAFRVSKDIQISGIYSYLHTDIPLLAAPKNKLDLQLDYTPGNFSFTLETNSIWNLYTQTGNDAVKVNYTLLNFRGAYTIPVKCPLTIFARLDNITNTRYEIVYGFPMPGITVMGGLELKF